MARSPVQAMVLNLAPYCAYFVPLYPTSSWAKHLVLEQVRGTALRIRTRSWNKQLLSGMHISVHA